MSVIVPPDLWAEARAAGWHDYPRFPDLAYALGDERLRAWMAEVFDELTLRRIRQSDAILERFARRHCPEALAENRPGDPS